MTTFDDFGPLPAIPLDATPANQQAWRLVRELRAQGRISSLDAMTIITALWESPAEPSLKQVLSPAPRAG